MSNTAAESVPAAQPQVADTPVSENARQPKKFDNVHKTVASKAKAFLNVFHSTGENIRGNINAALDGAGDAIAGRKSGEISGRKSGEQVSRRSVEPTVAAESTSAPVEAAAPAETTPALAAAVVATEAPATAPVEAQASAPAEASTSTEAAPAINVTTEAINQEASGEKRFPVGQFLNVRFRRTVDLVIRVGSTLRSKGTRTAESLGSTLAEKKDRASRRFSRAPKAAPAETAEATAAASPVAAPTPLPYVSAQQPTETTA